MCRLLAVTAVLVVSTLSAVADTFPKLNVEPSCRAAARMGDSMDAKLQVCMKEEETARATLEKDWTKSRPGAARHALDLPPKPASWRAMSRFSRACSRRRKRKN